MPRRWTELWVKRSVAHIAVSILTISIEAKQPNAKAFHDHRTALV
jgi:hypothetical protein